MTMKNLLKSLIRTEVMTPFLVILLESTAQSQVVKTARIATDFDVGISYHLRALDWQGDYETDGTGGGFGMNFEGMTTPSSNDLGYFFRLQFGLDVGQMRLKDGSYSYISNGFKPYVCHQSFEPSAFCLGISLKSFALTHKENQNDQTFVIPTFSAAWRWDFNPQFYLDAEGELGLHRQQSMGSEQSSTTKALALGVGYRY